MHRSIVLVDNYDSFAHNLARYFRQLEQIVEVVRNDRISVADVAALNPAAVVMSPGPCTPDEAGICLELVRTLHRTVPLLGVCLGHQAICQAFGATIGRTDPVHGRATMVRHNGHPLFEDVPSPFAAGRYHSLVAVAATLPPELETIATGCAHDNKGSADEALVMAVAHRQYPVYGVQFHPESILTNGGYRLLANFLTLAGIRDTSPAVANCTI